MASRFRLPGIVFLLVLAVYLAVPTKQYYWDGVGFAIEIERAPQLRPTLANSNHLVYEPAGYYAWRALNAAGIHAGAHAILRYANMLMGAAAAAFLCAILLQVLGSAYLAACLSLLFAFSATWWKFSTDANAYIPAVLLLLACFRLLLPPFLGETADESADSPPRALIPVAVALGAVHAGAMLVHQLAVFFLPVALHGLWHGSRAPRVKRLAAVGAYTAVAAGISLPAHWYGCYLETHETSPRAFFHWITYHTPGTSFSFNPLRNLLKSLDSSVHLFFGGKGSEILPAIRSWRVVLVALFLACLFYVIRELGRIPWRALWHAGWELAKDAAGLRHTANGRMALLAYVAGLAFTWIVVYKVFLFFWLPQNAFYRLLYLPAIMLLPAVVWRAADVRGGSRRYALAAFVAGVALFNFTFFIYPNSRVEANAPLDVAERLRPYIVPGTVVFFVTLPTDDWPLFYMYRDADWAQLKIADLPAVENRIRQAAAEGRTAWAETTTLDLLATAPGGAQWIEAHTRPGRKVEVIDRKHRIRVVQLFP